MIENKDLRIFAVVAETGSFTHAADQLHLTQSAVSKRFLHLEQELGVTLIQRQERPWRLTASGERLLPMAKHLLSQVADIEQAISQSSFEPSGVLSVGISHHLSLYRLPNEIKTFQKRYPKVLLNLSFLTSDEVHQNVLQKQIDIGYATLKHSQPSRLTYHPIWNDELIFVANTQDKQLQQRIDFQQLCDRPAVLPQTSSLYFQMVNQLFLDAGYSITKLFPANYLETVRSMVSVGLGWSVLPKAMLDKRLIELDMNIQHNLTRTLGALHREGTALSPAAKAFLALSQKTSNVNI